MNPKYHLLVAVAALSLGGCSTDDTVTEPEKGGYKISFTVAEDSETRTTLVTGDKLRWVPTDKVGIYTVGKNKNSNTLTVADVNQSPVEFIGVLENLVSKGDNFYAYYPYNAAQSTDPKAVKLTIPTAQTQNEVGVYNGESQPLVALPKTFEWENDSYAGRISSVRFRLLGAIVELQIFSSNETLRSETIQSVKFVSENPLAGNFTFDLTGVTVDKEPQISGYKLTEVKTTLVEPATIAAEDGKALVYLTIAPGTYTGKFVVETDIAQYTFSLAEAMEFKRAVIKGLPADLAGAKRDVLASKDPIDFEDENVKDICIAKENNWDTNGDGELSYREAAAVTSIGYQFYNKSIRSFNELRYFTGLQSIKDNTFAFCRELTSIQLPDNVTSIGEYAFNKCSSLTSIQLPVGLTSIGLNAFIGCSSLTSINLPDGVTSIGEYAFQNCSNLKSINLPDGVTEIGGHAFLGCSSLTSINIPKTVLSIGKGVFYGCSSLAAFEGEYASEDHRCLIQSGTLLAFAPANRTTYTIPDGVTSIGDSAFSQCSSLTSITIPDGVTSIGEWAFGSCSSLTSINIPEGVTAIGNYVFIYCSSLTSITIPDGVKSIGDYAFKQCSNLTSITIPDGVTSIGDSAFSQCSSLTSITIPDGVKSIGDYAFEQCSNLTSITIPDVVTAIGNYVFNGCSSLTSVYCKPTNPPTLGSRPFYNTPSSMKIYVTAASVEKYKAAEGWSEYADRIFADNN